MIKYITVRNADGKTEIREAKISFAENGSIKTAYIKDDIIATCEYSYIADTICRSLEKTNVDFNIF